MKLRWSGCNNETSEPRSYIAEATLKKSLGKNDIRDYKKALWVYDNVSVRIPAGILTDTNQCRKRPKTEVAIALVVDIVQE
jgi:hypothetical protein